MPLAVRAIICRLAFMLALLHGCLFLAAGAFAVEPGASTADGGPARPKVLILYSYTTLRGYTLQQQKGILSALDPRASRGDWSFDLYEETLAAESPTGVDGEMFSERLRDRYSDIPLDLIIVTDTPALEFIDRYWESCLPVVPLVFSAPSYVPPRLLASNLPVTGVVEASPGPPTVELIALLHPGTRRIFMITQRSEWAERFNTAVQQTADRLSIEVEVLTDSPRDEALRRLRSGPRDSVVLALVAPRDSGWDMDPPGMFSQVSPFPLYCLYEAHIGTGPVGGVVAGGERYGAVAGAMARRILNGTNVRSIPIDYRGANTPIFDARQLARWDIPLSRLPPGSILRHQEPAAKYRFVQETLIGLIGVGIATVFVVLWLRERRASAALTTSQERFRALGENLPGIPFTTLHRPDGRRLAEYLGPRLEHFIGPAAAADVRRDLTLFLDLIHPDDRAQERTERLAAIEQRRNYDCEYRIITTDGSYRWMRSTATPIPLPDGGIRWHGVLLDIDSVKRSQQSLIRRDAILHAVAEAGRLLAQAERPGDVMNSVLKHLGEAAGADRAYLFDRIEDPSVGMVNRMIAEWCADGIPAQINDPRYSTLPDAQWDRDRWLEPLSSGRTIVHHTADAPEPERTYFESQGLKTVALVPVGIVDRWWGFLGFDACRAPADWSAVELDALRAAANAIAASLERDIREARLREQDEVLRRIAASIPGFVYRLSMSADETIRLEYITRGFNEIFGTDPNWEPHPLSEHNNRHAPEDRRRIADVMRRCASTLEPLDIITRIIQPRGDSRWIHLRATTTRRNRETIFDGVAIDITERRAAEESFRRSEERYRLTSRAGDDVIWDWDFLSMMLTWNETLGRITGYVLPDLRSPIEWWSERVHPDDLERVERSLYSIINGTGSVWAAEYRFRHADGRYLDIRDRGYVVRDESGKAVRMVGAMVDYTRAKQAERVLRESEERHRRLVENLPVGVCLHDGSRFVYVNEAMRTLLHAPSSEALLTCPVSSLIMESEHAEASERCRAVIETGIPAPAKEQTLIRLDGSRVEVEIRCTPIEHEGRRLIHTTAVDLTERKQAEESFRRTAEIQQLLLNELDHRVKNSLAGLLTLIDLTQAAAPSIPEFADSIRSRVSAMVSVHALLSEGHWSPLPLDRIISALIPPGSPGSVRLTGPSVDVPARQVTALAMIAQELFTNSIKHGALGRAGGAVRIEWFDSPKEMSSEARVVALRWIETGGPPIVAPATPSAGTRLIEGFCRYELHGNACFNYSHHGVSHTFTFILDPRSATTPADREALKDDGIVAAAAG